MLRSCRIEAVIGCFASDAEIPFSTSPSVSILKLVGLDSAGGCPETLRNLMGCVDDQMFLLLWSPDEDVDI